MNVQPAAVTVTSLPAGWAGPGGIDSANAPLAPRRRVECERGLGYDQGPVVVDPTSETCSSCATDGAPVGTRRSAAAILALRSVAAHEASIKSQVARVVDRPAERGIAGGTRGGSPDASRGVARLKSRGAELDLHTVKLGCPEIEQAAAHGVGGSRRRAAGSFTGIHRAAPGNREVPDDRGDTGQDLEDSITEVLGADAGILGAGSLDDECVPGPGQVEIALCRAVILARGVGEGEHIVPGLEDDRIVLPVGIGRDDGGAQRARVAVAGRGRRVEGGEQAAVFEPFEPWRRAGRGRRRARRRRGRPMRCSMRTPRPTVRPVVRASRGPGRPERRVAGETCGDRSLIARPAVSKTGNPEVAS